MKKTPAGNTVETVVKNRRVGLSPAIICDFVKFFFAHDSSEMEPQRALFTYSKFSEEKLYYN